MQNLQLTIPVRITRLPHSVDLSLPRYMTELAAGMDLAAAISEPLTLKPGAISMVPTGLAVALPPGYELQIRPRSGLAIKHGLTVVNAPGTIDADYRGEIRVGLINLGKDPFRLHRGDRIAQMVLGRCYRVDWQEISTLPPTDRGEGGFGHTGAN